MEKIIPLCLRSVHYTGQNKLSVLKVNNIMLVQDENLPRSWWKLGRIAKTFIGRNGMIGFCEIKTANSTRKHPVQLLYNLEISDHS